MKYARKYSNLLKNQIRIDDQSDLIPLGDLQKVIEELRCALAPCTQPLAQSEVRNLAACYPTFRPQKPWLDQIEAAFKDIPCDVIKKACANISETETFPPNKATIKTEIDALMTGRRKALNCALDMEKEHQRRIEDAPRAAEREKFKEWLNGRSPLQAFEDEMQK